MKTLELTDNEMVYLNLSNRQFLRYTNSYFKHKIYLTYTVVCIAVIFLFCLIKECVGGGVCDSIVTDINYQTITVI